MQQKAAPAAFKSSEKEIVFHNKQKKYTFAVYSPDCVTLNTQYHD
ncbi:hypothetical protein FLA_1918 [Filimonas lacunae]|nr:hypothetical protein FLA_1918 [Filimonas lacunae]